jgi:hypothetical protein
MVVCVTVLKFNEAVNLEQSNEREVGWVEPTIFEDIAHAYEAQHIEWHLGRNLKSLFGILISENYLEYDLRLLMKTGALKRLNNDFASACEAYEQALEMADKKQFKKCANHSNRYEPQKLDLRIVNGNSFVEMRYRRPQDSNKNGFELLPQGKNPVSITEFNGDLKNVMKPLLAPVRRVI